MSYVITMYISKPEEINISNATIENIARLKSLLADVYGGFTLIPNCEGSWLAPDGKLCIDNVDKIEIMVDTYNLSIEASITWFIKRFGDEYNQQALPFHVVLSENHMVQM